MAVQPLVTFNAATANLDPTNQIALPVMAWMTSYGAPAVPETALPWMLAQGWQINGSPSRDANGNYLYPMSRQGMINWAVLQSLVNTYTDAYNEGRSKNALRYDQVVSNWMGLIGSTLSDLNNQKDNSNAYSTVYLSSLSSLMGQVDALVAAAKSDATTQYQNLLAQIQTYQGQLGQFQSNYATFAGQMAPLMADEAALSATFQANYPAALAQLMTDFNALLAAVQALEATAAVNLANFTASYTTVLGQLQTDWATHTTTTWSYLVNLGVAERARITEQWASTLANELQALTSRGLSASALVASIRDRNTTLLNRDLTDLNDKLNRELLENEHRTYEQLTQNVRKLTMDGLERIQQLNDALTRWEVEVQLQLERELDQARLKALEGLERQHSISQEIDKLLAQQTETLGVAAQKALGDQLAGEATAISQGAQAGEFAVNARHRLAALQLEANVRRLEGQTEVHKQEQELYRYMIDTTNNLVVGLFGFQERRTDAYPSLEIMAQLCSQLGDNSSCSWVSP